MSEEVDLGERHVRRVASIILVAIGTGGVVDIILDQPDTILSFHILFELFLLAFALSAAAYLSFGWRRAGARLTATQVELEEQARQHKAWRARTEQLLAGLGVEIDRQFEVWRLTPSERDTALLVLKGLGYKEIATLQGKSERTVRQHALASFAKSGLSGRAEFAAFFLEDLLLPRGVEERSTA